MRDILLISQLIAHLKFTTPAKLQYWLGSAFRGALGRNLRQICCIDFRKDCQTCESQEDCLFFYIYMRNRAKRGYAAPIKPIILIPPFFGKELYLEKNGFLKLELLLVGDFVKYFPHVILGLSLLGKRGLGNMRYENVNRFVIESIESKTSKSVVFDGENINLSNFCQLNIKELDGLKGNSFLIKFRTPYTGHDFPPAPERFIERIRNRFIRFVNEYGTQEHIPESIAEGKLESVTRHFHYLPRRSSRSNKTLFKGNTGIVSYKYSFLNSTARWLLHVGSIIGCGPDTAFGCGFFDISSKMALP
ncbi:MAG: hypothetical protein ACFFD2_06545 [Promethearchaeota archaeon]